MHVFGSTRCSRAPAGWYRLGQGRSLSRARCCGTRVRPTTAARPSRLPALRRRKPLGILEAKPAGTILANVEPQRDDYAEGMPGPRTFQSSPCPSPTCQRGARRGSRTASTRTPAPGRLRGSPPGDARRLARRLLRQPRPLRHRLQHLPELDTDGPLAGAGAGDPKPRGVVRQGRPRAHPDGDWLGEAYTAANVAYRLVRYGGAKRILFLVDRANLGRQT